MTTEPCPDCAGTGLDPDEDGAYECLTCLGSGLVERPGPGEEAGWSDAELGWVELDEEGP